MQRTPSEVAVHSFHPEDWAYIKAWKSEPLAPRWLGPFQILLITETAIRTKELGWTHHTRAKHAVNPEGRWEAVPVSKDGLKTVFRRRV